MSRDHKTKFPTEPGPSGWREILDKLLKSQRARSISNKHIHSEAREAGLNHISEIQQMADAIPGNILGQPLDRSTLTAGTVNTRSKVFALYEIKSPACITAIEEEDAEAFDKAYDEQHKDHVLTIIQNTGQYAPGAGGKRAAGKTEKSARAAAAATEILEPAPTPVRWRLHLEDRDDVKPPVSRTLDNVSIVPGNQDLWVGENGYLSAIVRCHEAKWGGVAVAVTSCLLTFIPKRGSKRSVNPPALKDAILYNGHGDRVVVERIDRYTVRVRTAKEDGKKLGPLARSNYPVRCGLLSRQQRTMSSSAKCAC